jgi:hypothetical protein
VLLNTVVNPIGKEKSMASPLILPQAQAGTSGIMRAAVLLLLSVALIGCSSERGRTTQMNPDCSQVSAEERARGDCMHRPEMPDGL